MSKRSYQHYCPLASALDLVGERWALLIVRDLLLGPKRYKDLLRGLSGIGTNILATRLKELEQAKIIHQRVLPPPAGSTVYELTEYGRELEDIVLGLARWGTKSLAPRQPEQVFKPVTLMIGLRENFRTEAAQHLHTVVELHFEDDEIYSVQIAEGSLSVRYGSAIDPNLVVRVDIETFLQLQSHRSQPEEAIAHGTLHLDGDAHLFPTFLDLFQRK